MNPVRLYTTLGCHLCERAHDMLKQLEAPENLDICLVEIGDDDQLTEQFGTAIPVVEFADQTRLYWPFEQTDLRHRLHAT